VGASAKFEGDYLHTPLPPEIRALLGSLDDPEKLLGFVLEHALLRSGAVRGLIFDGERVVRSFRYSQGDKIYVWRALERLLLESHGTVRSSKPFFGALGSDSPALGVAAALQGPSGSLAVLAVEKEIPLTQAEIDEFTDWIQLTYKPLDVAISYARWNRDVRRQPPRLRDLLGDLEQVPNMAEVERLLVAVAMNKNQNNRGKAAAALGISREGLRKKLLKGYL
jgi:hypothetical protein